MFSLQQQARTSRCGSSGAPRRSSSSAVVSARRKTTTSKRLSPLRASNNNAFSHSFGASSWRPDGGDDASHSAGRDAGSRIVHDIVAKLGGSISAEHGLGAMKTAEALHYKSPVEVAALRAIRQALDPKRIMNPRVLF